MIETLQNWSMIPHCSQSSFSLSESIVILSVNIRIWSIIQFLTLQCRPLKRISVWQLVLYELYESLRRVSGDLAKIVKLEHIYKYSLNLGENSKLRMQATVSSTFLTAIFEG